MTDAPNIGGFLWGLVIGAILWIPVGYAIGRAEEIDMPATLAQVNAILRTDVSTVPRLEIVDRIPGGYGGAWHPGLIQVARTEPEACWPLIAAHEVSHDVAVAAGLIRAVPNRDVKKRLEEIADIVEARFEPWSPNCRTDR